MQIQRKLFPTLFLLFLVGGTCLVLSRSRWRESEGQIFGTTYHIKYAATQDFSKEIYAELMKVDSALSMFNQQSTLSRFNRGEDIQVDPRFEEVVNLSQKISRETSGAFDITVAPLVNAWGFGTKKRNIPTQSQIDSIRRFIGYEKLQYKNGRLTKNDARLSIDAGAIAKGYGVDRVAALLHEKGCQDYMVEVGGEVVVHGENSKGKTWTVGIAKPVEQSTNEYGEIQEILLLRDKAVATSGNYRNYYYNKGKKYAHTIHPRTGKPVLHSLLSATVVAPSCAQADAYATAFMVMGVNEAKNFLKTHRSLDACFIYIDKAGKLREWSSVGMSKMLTKP